MKKIFNIVSIVLVMYLTVITTIILNAHFSSSTVYSIRVDILSVVIAVGFLLANSLFNLFQKSWKMIFVSVLGIGEIILLIILK